MTIGEASDEGITGQQMVARGCIRPHTRVCVCVCVCVLCVGGEGLTDCPHCPYYGSTILPINIALLSPSHPMTSTLNRWIASLKLGTSVSNIANCSVRSNPKRLTHVHENSFFLSV